MKNEAGPPRLARSSGEAGQTLIEMIVVITVGIMVVGALTFAVLFSLRNAKFSQNQNQATKLAQEGLEKLRRVRAKDGVVNFIYGSPSTTTTKFSDLWNVRMYETCSPCYFTFSTDGVLIDGSSSSFENLVNFQRQIQIQDVSASYNQEKTMTAVVKWTDATGDHQSKLTTILSKL